MENVNRVAKLIETSSEAKDIFDKAVYFENEAAKIDYVNKPVDKVVQQDIDDYDIVFGQYLHYFKQLGLNGAEWEELKIRLQ